MVEEVTTPAGTRDFLFVGPVSKMVPEGLFRKSITSQIALEQIARPRDFRGSGSAMSEIP
jgi:hypothetical protein